MFGKIAKVPMILQMEACECGAASLGMILSYYGRRLPLEQLRIDCGVSSNGSNLSLIKAAAERNGLIARAYKMEPSAVRQAPFPVIIHWNTTHFVVLCGFNKRGAVIADPACGMVNVTPEDFSKSFTGIVMTFEKSETFSRLNYKKGANFISVHVKKFIPSLIFSIIVGTILSVFRFLVPFFDTAFIDKILIDRKTAELPVLIIFMIICMMFISISGALGSYLHNDLEKKLSLVINSDFMLKMTKLPIIFFTQRNPGELTNRQHGNLKIAENLCFVLISIIVNVFFGVIYVVGFFLFDLKIGIVGLFSVALNVTVILISANRLDRNTVLFMRNDGVLRGGVSAAIDMIETTKSCGCEDSIFERIMGAAAKNYTVSSKMEMISTYATTSLSLINNLINALLLTLGIGYVISGKLTIGVLIAISGLLSVFLGSLNEVSTMSLSMRSLKGNIEAANDAMNYASDGGFLENIEEQTRSINGDIQIEDLSFSYGLYAPPVIKNLSLGFGKGESVAIVGKSGSGKSTLLKLLMGLYSPTSGKILYSGNERFEFSKEYFYFRIAIVDQNIRMFEGTVLDNISMFDKDISYEEAVEAAKIACIHNVIINRESAYYASVLENGKNFSGGQRQRIEIARALAKKPEILILDEATSALDDSTEAMVMENIKAKNITLIIISHRLSTIRNCNKIVVLNNGEIFEQGSHEGLIKADGIYKKLVSGGEI